ncbi:organomercurial lyase [Streptomyces sp. NBC_01267]|uniref:organomercurial lyase n=1 Tax=Streptomyces sp. NBC_01267 TaxID=2903805 RepID=UPI002E31D1B7|nr:organomercurial lyase [Streptomyces sp. NBC_01267]
MRITVLTVPDCPNGPVVQARITTALGGRDAEMELVEVSEQAEAERAGMSGSPTVLLDGVDPFGSAGATPSVSCRIYRHAGGEVDGAPSVDELRTVLTAAGLTSTDLTSTGLPDPADGDCCAGDALDLVGRGSLPAPAADVCCDTLNFFADRTASAWAGQHPDVNGTVVDQASAERIGRTTFGPLLTDS